ncbi:MAG: FG-GAP-like repeat-containing protein [Verrucomicrobiia bacterium]
MKSFSRYSLVGACLVLLLFASFIWRSSDVSEPLISSAPTSQTRSVSSPIIEPKLAHKAGLRIGEAIQRKRRERALSARLNQTPYEQASSGRLPAAFMNESEIAERLDGFSDWLGRYLESDGATRKSLEAEGFEAARNRRPAMTELIMLDPELAIELAVAREIRPELPASILPLLEVPLDARSRYDVLIACGSGEAGGVSETIREVDINGESKRVFTYGRRLGVTTKENLPFHGIQLDNLVAMHESPVRRMSPGELPENRRPPVGEVAVEIGGQVLTLPDDDASEMEAELSRREDRLGPIAALGVLPSGQLSTPVTNSTHTEGPKTMLAIRVRFSDDPLPGGSPIDDATMAIRAIEYADYWREVSYGRSTVTVSYTPVLVSALNTAAHLATGLGGIVSDGSVAARAAGFEPDDYDFVTVVTKGGHGYCGVAGVGGRRSHLVCYTVRTANHEFGHNLGLWHANYNYTSHPTDPTSQDPVSGAPNSPHLEYGHWYSVQSGQGSGRMDIRAHYSPREKLRIDWLTSNETLDIGSSGTYRLNQLDHLDSKGVRGLKIPTGDAARPNYWLSFRTAYTSDEWLKNSAQFDWTRENYNNEGILMLDMTPQSQDGPLNTDNNDKRDSGLLIGRTYFESRSDVYITPIGKGGARPDEWLDVQVNFGPFPLNRAPEVSLTPQFSQVNVGEAVTLTVSATDPEDDPVAYDWDFSDGSFDPAVLNQSVVTHSFSTDGIYLVSVSVSDMKGGTALGTAIVKVGNATGNIVLIDDVVITEADDTSAPAIVTLSMVDPAIGTVTLDYATENGSATAGLDYSAASGSVTFNNGETTQIITLTVLGDVELEGDESFFVRLGNASTNAIIARSRAAVTIVDNEIVLAAPQIISIDPLRGPVASVVTITGGGFGLVPDQNIVYFGSVRANVLTATADELTVEVPSGVIYAPITVSFGGLSASSALPYVVTFDGDTAFGEMAYDSPVRFGTGGQPVAVAVGDLDGDGSPELVTANFGTSSFSVFLNATTPSSLTVGTFGLKQDFGTGVGPSAVGLVDIDGDGALDVVTVNQGAATISVFRNVSTSGGIAFGSRSDLATGSNPSGLAFADVDVDGRVDIIVANEGSSSISVFPNRGLTGSITVNSFSSKVDFIVGTKPVSVAAGDLNGDGKPEIVAANSFNGIGGNTLSVLLNQSSGSTITKASFVTALISPVAVGAKPGKVLLADFDPDDPNPKLDIAVLNSAGNTVQIFRNISSTLGNVELASPSPFATGLASRAMAIGDIDGDGAPDLVIANDDLGEVGLLRNKSGSQVIDFHDRVGLSLTSRPKNVVLGDLDQDGKPEIVTAHSSDVIEVRRNAVRTDVNIAWNDPANITYGTPLGGAQLNAVATLPGNISVAGSYIYSPPAGTVLSVDEDQILSVTFVPLDTLNYSTTTNSVMIDIDPAQLTFTLNATRPFGELNPEFAAKYVGFVNDDTEADLDMPPIIDTMAIQGSPIGNYLIIGMGAQDANYVINHYKPMDSLLTITAATPEIVWSNPADIRFGDALGGAQLNATSLNATSPVAGVFTYTPSDGDALAVGDGQTLSVMFAPEDSVNFTVAVATVTVNVKRGLPVIIWPDPSDIMFGTALGAGQLNASSPISGGVVYVPAVGDVLSAGGFQALSAMFTPDDLINYQPVSALATINVLRADTDITWNDPAEIAFGTPLSATQLNAVSSIAGTLVYTPPLGTILIPGDDQTLTVTLTPTDTDNNNTVDMSVEIDVRKATPVITWSAPSEIEFGAPLSGVQLNASAENFPGVLTYTPASGTVLNVGVGQTLSVTFTPDQPLNVESVTLAVPIDVRKSDPIITWGAPADIVFGLALTSAQLNPTADVPGTVVFDPPGGTVLDAGPGQVLKATFSPTDAANYNTGEKEVLINVARANPVINWPNPADIIFGTQLADGVQLNATAGVPGNSSAPVDGLFGYTPGAGFQLNAGFGQTLSTEFTPTDTANFNVVTALATINVLKNNPVIDWTPPAAIIFGTPLSGTQLNASVANPTGMLVYDPPLGAALNPGAGQTLRATFTPDDTANHNVQTALVTIDVDLATPEITWPTPQDIVFGTPLDNTHLNATADVAGVFAYSPEAGVSLNVGAAQTLSVTFSPFDSNFMPTTKTVSINVDKADPVITWPNPGAIVFGTPLSLADNLNAFANVPGSFDYTPAPVVVLDAGLGRILTTTFTPTDSANYNSVNAQALINVLLAPPSLSWANPANITFGDPLGGAQLNATADGGLPGSFVYSPPAATVLNQGNFQLLSVTFTPTDSVNYLPATTTVTINVGKATPTVVWTPPADITYGAALSGLQLNATANIAGSFNYNPPLGTILNAGAGQILRVTFTPQDFVNYNAVAAQTSINLGPANLIVRADNKSRAFNAPEPAFTATFLGFVNGDTAANLTQPVVLATTAMLSSPAGNYDINGSGAASVNYAIQYRKGTLSVLPNIAPTVSLTAPSNDSNRPALSDLILTADAADTDGSVVLVEFFEGGVKLGESTASPYEFTWPSVPIGTYTLTAVATDDLNESTTSSPVTVNVLPGVNSAAVSPMGQVTVGLTGAPGVHYAIQASDDLITWTTIGSFIATGTTETFPDPDPAMNQGHRFYRIIPVSLLP